MIIVIKSPTKAIIKNYSLSEKEEIEKQLFFTRSNISLLLGKHKNNQWFKNKNYDAWNARLSELKSLLNGNCSYNEDGEFCVRPASISYLKGLAFEVENEIQYPTLTPFSWKVEPEFEPYPYQSSSVENLLKINHGCIELPTGCGKSFTLLMLAQRCGLKTVLVTPSKSIFNELLVEFQEKLGKAKVGGYGDGKKDIKKPITIAIGKSLANVKEGTKEWDFFYNKQVLMVDESHTFAADQLEGVCHNLLSNVPYRFFVSATQTRGDGTEKVLQSITGENVYTMSLKQAIDEGYLCPLKFLILSLETNSKKIEKDPLKAKRLYFLYNENIAKTIANMCNAIVRVKGESCLILVEELRQISMLKDLLNVPFGYVHSASKKLAAEWGLEKVSLQEQVDRFNKGEIPILIGTRAIATGTNMYPTHYTYNWMGGRSEIITKQGPMGRSTRRLEISKFKHLHKPKPYTTVVDFKVELNSFLQEYLGHNKLDNHLKDRVSYYSETGEKMNYKSA